MAQILIVDDDEDIRFLINDALNHAGHSVMEAENGIEAVKLLTQNPFDLVITDIVMPVMDGLELILDLNIDNPHVKIIAITGYGTYINQNENLEMADLIGVDDTLRKPFDLQTLIQKIQGCLGVSESVTDSRLSQDQTS